MGRWRQSVAPFYPLSLYNREADDLSADAKASLTYSTASTIPEKSLRITDCELTCAVFTGRIRVLLPFCFCPHDVMSNAMTRAKRNIFSLVNKYIVIRSGIYKNIKPGKQPNVLPVIG